MIDERTTFPTSEPSLPDAAPMVEVTGPPTSANTVPPRMLTWFRDIFISIVVSFFIITFLYQPVKVEGGSMMPRLQNEDRLVINKFVYRFQKIERGDVVVFYYPYDPSVSYIKRIIALPGDDLRIDKGDVYVNGRKIAEPYVPEDFRDMRSREEAVIPKGEYFVMGDHRSNSTDSREFGPVARNLIYGKAALIIWPGVDAGVVR